MWFLPLGRLWEPWFTAFLVRLLEADPPTLRCSRTTRSTGSRRVGAGGRVPLPLHDPRGVPRDRAALDPPFQREVIGPVALRAD